MGTWSVDAFGNDYAQDWAEDLHETSNLDAVEDTLNTVLDSGAELEAPFAAEALAAIEVLARLQGKGGPQTEDSAAIDEWVEARKAKAKPRADLAEKALRAIERITAPDSELRQLWEESEHYADWCASVEDLRTRLA
jgi:ABC-type transporter Mla subunit MlaD